MTGTSEVTEPNNLKVFLGTTDFHTIYEFTHSPYLLNKIKKT